MSGQRSAWRTRVAAGAAAAMMVVFAHAEERAASTTRSDVVVQALSLLGTPYRFGGGSPDHGFDCSGLVRHVFGSVLQRDLPRRAEDISSIGQPVSKGDLQPGDLVFFNTLRRAFSHVAIYIGEGRFVHAPAKSGRVRIEGLDDRYWAARFNGARRVVDSPMLPAAAGAPPVVSAVDDPGIGLERAPEP